MKNQLKEMIKSVLEENAVGFKDSTSNALYQKVSDRLNDQYKNIAKTLFSSINLKESAPVISSDVTPTVASETAKLDGPLGVPQMPNQGGDAPPIPRGPNGEQGMTIEEFVKQYYKKKEDFDNREAWLEWLQQYYKQYIELMKQWERERQWRSRGSGNPPKPWKYPSWKEFRQREEQQPLPRRWLENQS